MAEAVFQFAPESSGSNLVGVSGAAPTLGVSGGNSTNNGAVRFADTTDLGAGSTLPAFLSEAFAPKIQAMVQQRIFEGATQAAIGRCRGNQSPPISHRDRLRKFNRWHCGTAFIEGLGRGEN